MKTKKICIIIAMALMPLLVIAQPAAVKNAGKAVFTLTTFKADGSLLASSHGIFVGKNGEAISQLKPFEGAASAVVIDNSGKKMNVIRILGANDIYDVIKQFPRKIALRVWRCSTPHILIIYYHRQHQRQTLRAHW